MSSNTVSTCPYWCDPRVHVDHDADSPEHRTAGLTWQPLAGAETSVSVRTIRLDNTGECGHVGDELVSLRITNLYDPEDGADFPFTETDLNPADARMLAAALLVEVERVESKRGMAAVLRRGVTR